MKKESQRQFTKVLNFKEKKVSPNSLIWQSKEAVERKARHYAEEKRGLSNFQGS